MLDTFGLPSMLGEMTIEEALRHKIYVDTKGKRSIGIGRNLDDVGITTPEAYFLCGNDLDVAATMLDRELPWWRTLSPVRQRVLLDMCFNMGWPVLSEFRTFLAQMHAAQFAQAASSMLASLWAKEVGPRATRLSTMVRTNLPPAGIPAIILKGP